MRLSIRRIAVLIFFSIASLVLFRELIFNLYARPVIAPASLWKEGCTPQCRNFKKRMSMVSRHAKRKCIELSVETHDCLLLGSPSPFVRYIVEAVLGSPLDGSCVKPDCKFSMTYDEEGRAWGNDWPPFGYAMMGRARLLNFYASIAEVNRKEIPGEILELGVWRGGGMMLASAANIESDMKRGIHSFDAFDNIKEYNAADAFLSVKEEDVRYWFEKLGVMNEYVYFHVGLFKDTVPRWNPQQKIAVLRIDGNFYDSYQDAMYYLYGSVSVGGIVIFDDVINHPSVARFWNDFKNEQGLEITLNQIDAQSAWFRKPSDVTLDWKYFRAPQDANRENVRQECPEHIREKTFGRCHASWHAP